MQSMHSQGSLFTATRLALARVRHGVAKTDTEKEGSRDLCINVERPDGASLGLNIGTTPCGRIHVLSVVAGDNWVSRWNRENPKAMIQPGDEILSVNGVAGNLRTVVGQFWMGGEVTVKIRPTKKKYRKVTALEYNTPLRCPLNLFLRLSASDADADICTICYQDFEADETVTQLPCGHAFHPGCLAQWSAYSLPVVCPYCKREATSREERVRRHDAVHPQQ
eukprot:CAMPEP_0117515382 /NCGR_PEP_ID=MMETSP0784-20121206/30551_1 /TAXON_ID=39447 /ORGANISM="" /LENGTH=221 /DNA_ID=CAMNT_0005311197 /DNA_START=74 /DNA_END=742 /DNA_ORIENTATION=+